MRFSRIAISAVLLVTVAAVPSAAQDSGFFPIEDFGLLDRGDLDVDINLEGAGIQIAIGAMEHQDPRLVDLVSGLTRVRVQVGGADELAAGLVIDRIDQAKARLEAEGWVRMIQVEESTQRVYLYTMSSDAGRIAGITALVHEGVEEVVLVNIAGDIDPFLLGGILANLGEMDLSGFLPPTTDDD